MQSTSITAKLAIVLLLTSAASISATVSEGEGAGAARPIDAADPAPADPAVADTAQALSAVPVTLNICLLWQDRVAEIAHTDPFIMRRCLGTPGGDHCEWEARSDVTPTNAVALTHQGFVRIDADGEPPLQARLESVTFEVKDLASECETMAAALLAGVSTLSTAAKIGVGLGAAAGVLLVEDEGEPESVSRP